MGKTVKAVFSTGQCAYFDLLLSARRVYAAAASEAGALRAGTRKDLAAHIRRVRKKAVLTGTGNGYRSVMQEIGQKMDALSDLYRETVARANLDCLNIVLQIAEAVVGKAATEDREALAGRIAGAVSGLQNVKDLRVTVNSGDLAEVAPVLKRLGIDAALSGSDKVSAGNASVESGSGRVELNWAGHLAVIGDELKRELEEKLANLKI